MKSIGVILALAFLKIVSCQRTPTISYISQEQIKDIGDTVELLCSVQYGQEYPVLWIKFNKEGGSDQLPLSSGTSLIVRDSRFALRYDTASSTYTLQIKDIQETDAGVYQCQVLISLNNRISAGVELQVRRPPIISDNSTRSLVVSEGQPVQLNCYAGGFPTPRISWRRENNAILPTGGSIYRGNTLKVSAIRKEDRGTYYCVAENGVGRGARRNINVEVEFAPVITAPRPRLGQALQYDMNLECHVEAYPPPAITWIKDDIELSNNQHYSISHFATADEYTDTTIRVITIEKRQYGEFICRAANKLGTAQTTVQLFETIIPVCPPACGQAIYGTGVIPMSSGPLIALALVLAAFLRNFYTKY
ncbi:lachesin isoform X1 [Cephus cinctus]|uniref:Lachesin isoform X1 n=1 Tax=Cephus cinctus TaxID=211228 RepID=A0AAJ7BHY7_CEPCN|nr:lachesin isoform X1 [Cephus cinctus]